LVVEVDQALEDFLFVQIVGPAICGGYGGIEIVVDLF
jgi:hypothetical protein